MNRPVSIVLPLVLAAAGCRDSRPPNVAPSTGSIRPEVPGTVVGANAPEGTGAKLSDPFEGLDVTAAVPPGSGQPHETCEGDHLRRAFTQLEGGRTEEAIAELERGVFDDPDDVETRRLLGEVYRSNGDAKSAVLHLERAAERAGDPQTWELLAETRLEQRDYDGALTALRRVTRIDRGRPETYRLMARAYQGKEMWKESIEASEEAIAHGSDSPWTYSNLGLAHLVLGRYDDAVRELEKAVSFESGVSPRIWNNLGLAYEKRGELVRAVDAYRTALQGDPGYVKAKVNLTRSTEIAKRDGIAVGERTAEIKKVDLETLSREMEREAGASLE